MSRKYLLMMSMHPTLFSSHQIIFIVGGSLRLSCMEQLMHTKDELVTPFIPVFVAHLFLHCVIFFGRCGNIIIWRGPPTVWLVAAWPYVSKTFGIGVSDDGIYLLFQLSCPFWSFCLPLFLDIVNILHCIYEPHLIFAGNPDSFSPQLGYLLSSLDTSTRRIVLQATSRIKNALKCADTRYTD